MADLDEILMRRLGNDELLSLKQTQTAIIVTKLTDSTVRTVIQWADIAYLDVDDEKQYLRMELYPSRLCFKCHGATWSAVGADGTSSLQDVKHFVLRAQEVLNRLRTYAKNVTQSGRLALIQTSTAWK
jgi:hypothetical protein